MEEKGLFQNLQPLLDYCYSSKLMKMGMELWDIVFTELEGKTMVILGMPEAGKTQFYKTLKGESYDNQEATGIEEYEGFKFQIAERTIRVKAGKDIGGSQNYIAPYYKKFIKENDIIVFVFDIKRYVEDTTYAQDVRDRLDFVWRKLSEKADFLAVLRRCSLFIRRKFLLLGSHSDQLTSEQIKKAMESLHESTKDKEYQDMFRNNFFLLDLRDRKELFEKFIKTKLFG